MLPIGLRAIISPEARGETHRCRQSFVERHISVAQPQEAPMAVIAPMIPTDVGLQRGLVLLALAAEETLVHRRNGTAAALLTSTNSCNTRGGDFRAFHQNLRYSNANFHLKILHLDRDPNHLRSFSVPAYKLFYLVRTAVSPGLSCRPCSPPGLRPDAKVYLTVTENNT